jgi:predicted acetyltransferase
MTEWMSRFGGHIGFEVRPSRRRMGYGTEALRLVLPRAFSLELEQVLITCGSDNIGSRRIIESNGGLFDDEILEPDLGVMMRRYRLQTRPDR